MLRLFLSKIPRTNFEYRGYDIEGHIAILNRVTNELRGLSGQHSTLNVSLLLHLDSPALNPAVPSFKLWCATVIDHLIF
jgi:hypothetical protein